MSSYPVRLPTSVFLRPERQVPEPGALEKAQHWLMGLTRFIPAMGKGSNRRLLKAIHRQSDMLSQKTDEQLQEEAANLRIQFQKSGHSREYLVKAFTLIREVSGRALGMYHFDSQILGGLALYQGHIAEMQTGEGKTLTATLPAAAAAMGGVPVHVITVNDYLASRDAELMRPVYERLGLSVGCIVHEMSREERQQAYACDLVYCTNKELVFDYLKDHIQLKQYEHPLQLYGSRLLETEPVEQQLMLRGLHYAIVDEADSVLLDEARSPLVISGTVAADEEQNRIFRQALEIAEGLVEGEHYERYSDNKAVALLEKAEPVIQKASETMGAFWIGRIRRNELVHKALTALHLFFRDQHYIVVDGKVQIVDEHTGRVMADRSWEQGLHQMIEAKEGCALTNPRDTLARISYQRFFRMYHHLSGMTGTANEVTGELWQIYGLKVTTIPLHHPSKRRHEPVQLFRDKTSKWQAVVARIDELALKGNPVLIGTVSVAESEFLSNELTGLGIHHQLLNARHDSEEAEIIARAGQPGQVTVATSMAGRGTDIKLPDEVKTAGGLHVLLTEYHDASRIDRQLEGRCARQGDPGCFEVFLSMEDDLVAESASSQAGDHNSLSGIVRTTGLKKLKAAQRRLEKQHARSRKALFNQDQQRSETLAFTSSRI